MDHYDGKLMCTLGNCTVRLIAATGKKSIDERTVAGDLDGTYVQREAHVADKSKPGYTLVHHKEGNVEDPWRGENVCLSCSQTPESLEVTPCLC